MKIAILGTGNMGSAFAEGLLKSGSELIVYNRSKNKTEKAVDLGAIAVDTPEIAIKEAEAIILVLTDADSLRKVLLTDESKKVLQGKKILNASTTTPADLAEIELEVRKNGGSLAEITIMVGAEQLRSNEAHFILGCSDQDETFWSEILSGVGSFVRAGKTGDASIAEQPMLFASMFTNIATAYSVVLTSKLGLSNEAIGQFVPMAIPGSEYVLPNMLSKNYNNVMASVEGFQGVARSVIASAKSLGLPTKILEAMEEIYDIAADKGYTHKDGSSIVEVLLSKEN